MIEKEKMKIIININLIRKIYEIIENLHLNLIQDTGPVQESLKGKKEIEKLIEKEEKVHIRGQIQDIPIEMKS